MSTAMLFRRPLALRTMHTYLLRQSFTTACAGSRTCHGRIQCCPLKMPSHRQQQCRAAQSAADVVTESALSLASSKTQPPAPARRLVHTDGMANCCSYGRAQPVLPVAENEYFQVFSLQEPYILETTWVPYVTGSICKSYTVP